MTRKIGGLKLLVMGQIQVQFVDGTSEYFDDQNQHESHYCTLHPDGSLTVHRLDQPGDGSPPRFDEVVTRYGVGEFVGWEERS